MPKSHPPYPPAYRRQRVERVQAGRTPEDLAREFEPSAQAIRNWVAQAERDGGRRSEGATSAERKELQRLRRENRPLKLERDLLAKAAAWPAASVGWNVAATHTTYRVACSLESSTGRAQAPEYLPYM